MTKKKTVPLIVVLTCVCACTGQGVLPPLPGDAIELGADLYEESSDQQTGDVTIQYTLFLTNISDETLETVILKDFELPSDIVMNNEYFEIKNLRPGETGEVNFKVIVKGWGLNKRDQEWAIDFTIRIEKNSAYTEQTFYYGITLYA